MSVGACLVVCVDYLDHFGSFSAFRLGPWQTNGGNFNLEIQKNSKPVFL